jgi:hypothetical protein
MNPSPSHFRRSILKVLDPEKYLKFERQAYMRAYRLEYKKRRKMVRSTYSPHDYQQLCAQAQIHGLKLAEYQRKAAMAYAKQSFLAPSDMVEQLASLTRVAKRTGDNINQWVAKAHKLKRIFMPDLKAARLEMRSLIDEIKQFIRCLKPCQSDHRKLEP